MKFIMNIDIIIIIETDAYLISKNDDHKSILLNLHLHLWLIFNVIAHKT